MILHQLPQHRHEDVDGVGGLAAGAGEAAAAHRVIGAVHLRAAVDQKKARAACDIDRNGRKQREKISISFENAVSYRVSRRGCAGIVLESWPSPARACGGRLFGKRYRVRRRSLPLARRLGGRSIVNASIPALVALRGLDLDPRSRGAASIATQSAPLYSVADTEVMRVSRPWSRARAAFRAGARAVADIRSSERAPRRSRGRTYELGEQDGRRVYEQTVGASALQPGSLQNYGWNGGELVAFRLHLPSKIV